MDVRSIVRGRGGRFIIGEGRARRVIAGRYPICESSLYFLRISKQYAYVDRLI